MRIMLLAGASCALALLATQASAAVHTLVNVSIPSFQTVHITGFGLDRNVRMGDQLLDFDDLSPFLAYCLDPFHDAVLGAQSNLYEDDTFDSPEYGGFPFSGVALREIKGLVYLSGSASPLDKDAIQGGIWVKLGLTVSSTSALVQSRIDYWGASTYQVAGPLATLEPLGKGQAYTGVPVPEPATWAMLIMGFGAIGAVMRRRRTLALAA